MKTKIKYIIYFLLIITLIGILTSCTKPNPIKGSEIFKSKGIRKEAIKTLDIEYIDRNDPLNPKLISLSSDDENLAEDLKDLRNLIYKSKGLILSEDIKYIPLSDSSHFFTLGFLNDVSLEFFYSEDEDILVWHDVDEQDGKIVVSYYFLETKSPLSEIFSKLE